MDLQQTLPNLKVMEEDRLIENQILYVGLFVFCLISFFLLLQGSQWNFIYLKILFYRTEMIRAEVVGQHAITLHLEIDHDLDRGRGHGDLEVETGYVNVTEAAGVTSLLLPADMNGKGGEK